MLAYSAFLSCSRPASQLRRTGATYCTSLFFHLTRSRSTFSQEKHNIVLLEGTGLTIFVYNSVTIEQRKSEVSMKDTVQRNAVGDSAGRQNIQPNTTTLSSSTGFGIITETTRCTVTLNRGVWCGCKHDTSHYVNCSSHQWGRTRHR
jgi:hypothetical protein